MNQFLALSRPIPAGGSGLRRTTVKDRPKLAKEYPLDLSISYEIVGGRLGTGSGRTISIGSRSLVFSSDQILGMLAVNCKIRFTLDWPVTLEDGVGLRLCASGTVVGADENIVSIAFSGHEFRTCAKQQLPPETVACSPSVGFEAQPGDSNSRVESRIESELAVQPN
jgi:hypothetical protein